MCVILFQSTFLFLRTSHFVVGPFCWRKHKTNIWVGFYWNEVNFFVCDENVESRFKMPEKSIPKDAAFQIINDELMLDGAPRLNLASFVTTWMEPECDKLIMASLNKNYVDMDEYPVTTELQVCLCVTSLSSLSILVSLLYLIMTFRSLKFGLSKKVFKK